MADIQTATPPLAPTVPGTITVTGTGSATATPDVAHLSIGVQTDGPNATTAWETNSSRATAVIQTLKDSGVAATDIQTTNLSIQAQRDGNGRIIGYQVSDMLSVTVRHVDRVGTVLDAAAKAAGNGVRIDSLGFSFSDPAALMAKARTQAVTSAQDNARQLARAAGVRLGNVSSITESANPGVMPFAVAADAAAGSAVPVQPGTRDVSVSVQVVYKIAN